MEPTVIGVAKKHTSSSGFKLTRRFKLAHRPTNTSNLLIVTTFNHSASSTTREARGQKSVSTHSLPLMKHWVPAVLVLITLEYQGNNTKNLFRENPVPLSCFIAATFVYWLTLGAMKQITTITINHKHIFFLTVLCNASALFSLISLVALFLPYPLSLLPLALAISSAMIFAFLYAFHLFLKAIEFLVNIIHALFVRARSGGCNLTQEASSAV